MESGTMTNITEKVRGQVAISLAKTAYQSYREIFCSTRFKKLADDGARVQRLLLGRHKQQKS